MDFNSNKLKTVLVIILLVASAALVFIWLKCTEPTESFVAPPPSLPTRSQPKGILKRPGTKSIPKNVKFVEEFDLVNARNIPSDPWFQADPVTKYDPKFVDVFNTSF